MFLFLGLLLLGRRFTTEKREGREKIEEERKIIS
jgi:hypothetical protein